MGKKNQDVLFSENRFCSLLVWDLLCLTPWVFWSEIFTIHSSLCLLSFGWDLSPRLVPQDSQQISYWSLHGHKERKVRLCVKLFDFFPGWILIRLTRNLSRFVPNSVDILTRNFRKKPFWENFSEILCKPRLSSSKTCGISLYFLQYSIMWPYQ